ncbi:MAG: hypothetical protein ACRC46_01635 [Thermoguttaceae bacterium]
MNEVEFENTLRMFRPKPFGVCDKTHRGHAAAYWSRSRHVATIAASLCSFLLGIAFAYTFLFPKDGVDSIKSVSSTSPKIVYVMPTDEQLDAIRTPRDLLACRLVTTSVVPTIPQPAILSAIRSLEHDEWR